MSKTNKTKCSQSVVANEQSPGNKCCAAESVNFPPVTSVAHEGLSLSEFSFKANVYSS